MKENNSIISWAQGADRYINAENILSSESWEEAQDKINKLIEAGEVRGHHSSIYYDKNTRALWDEYRFLFLCQFLEFRTAEIFYELHIQKKVSLDFISKLKENKNADPERKSGEVRIISPASLLSDLGHNLGKLIKSLKNHTFDFDKKEELVNKLKQFNKIRNSFVHHSFNEKKAAGNINVKDIILDGTTLGKKILLLLDEIPDTLKDNINTLLKS